MRIVYGLRESMAVLLSGEPCTLTFWREGRLHRYKGFRYKDTDPSSVDKSGCTRH